MKPRTSLDKAELGKVAVLFGGNSAEREVSLKSGTAVIDALRAEDVDVRGFDTKNCELQDLVKFDRVFIALHGRGGEDGVIQGVLEQMELPYTGSGVMASAIAMDKIKTKLIWKALGLNTPTFAVVKDIQMLGEVLQKEKVFFPIMVKPVKEGSSLGMQKVDSVSTLEAAVSDALKFDREVLLEAWVEGPEFTIAILNETTLPPIRLETQRGFYDYQAKYQSDDTQYICPCGLGSEREQELKLLALDAFNALGCSGWGRVDVMQELDGSFQLLEVNTVPGMTDHSLVPMAAKASGLSFYDLLIEILTKAGVQK